MKSNSIENRSYLAELASAPYSLAGSGTAHTPDLSDFVRKFEDNAEFAYKPAMFCELEGTKLPVKRLTLAIAK